ncbi:MAG TPA: hypothetical protein VGC42_07085 [Kofleriaceae bacterium]
MNRFHVIALGALALAAGCASPRTVIVWTGASTGEQASIEIASNGHGRYKSNTEGVEDLEDQLQFTKGQIRELHDMFASHEICAKKHDPAYAPVLNEGQTTVDLYFDDLSCSLTMYDLEWQRPATREIAETMRSMKPLRVQKKLKDRKLNPQQLIR